MKFRFGLSIFLILLSLAAMAFGLGNSNGSNVIPILDLFELVDSPQKFQQREVRLRGFVKAGSILRQHGDRAKFIMEQEGRELEVLYLGRTQLPDTFTDGIPIRADGYLSPDKTFHSKRIEAKCASKYETPHAAPRT